MGPRLGSPARSKGPVPEKKGLLNQLSISLGMRAKALNQSEQYTMARTRFRELRRHPSWHIDQRRAVVFRRRAICAALSADLADCLQSCPPRRAVITIFDSKEAISVLRSWTLTSGR